MSKVLAIVWKEITIHNQLVIGYLLQSINKFTVTQLRINYWYQYFNVTDVKV